MSNLRGVFLKTHYNPVELPQEAIWIQRAIYEGMCLTALGLCGTQTDVIIAEEPVPIHIVRYAFTRLRNPKNPAGGKDFPEFYLACWREHSRVFIRIEDEVFEPTPDNYRVEFQHWLEDRLEL